MKRFLLDVNVLISLFDSAHVNHNQAHMWFQKNSDQVWATCPVTENGFVRILSNPSYPTVDENPSGLVSSLNKLKRNYKNAEFWEDTISISNKDIFEYNFLLSHKQVTDAYLLGLAIKNNAKLVTFDRGINFSAVKKASKDSLEYL